MISGNMVGSYSQLGRTLTLVDENGTELTGVVVDQETIFTAGDNDVRSGIVYASNDGVSTGTKKIPAYHTSEGSKLITAGSDVKIKLASDELYDFTKLQVIICKYNSSMSKSVYAEKVSINGEVYDVKSTVSISTVVKDSVNYTINLGITNTDSSPLVVRYFTYKEIY